MTSEELRALLGGLSDSELKAAAEIIETLRLERRRRRPATILDLESRRRPVVPEEKLGPGCIVTDEAPPDSNARAPIVDKSPVGDAAAPPTN